MMMMCFFAQSDVDVVGAYGGGVRADVVDVHSFLTPPIIGLL